MRYPTLTELSNTREIVDVFKGYNHNLRIGDGEFYDMKNLTSSEYPVLSPRKQRGVYASPNAPKGLIAKDALCYVDGSRFVINEYPVEMGLNDEPKTLVSMGAYVIIMPDKKWVCTAPKDGETAFEHGNIEAVVETPPFVELELCKLDGEIYVEMNPGDTAPPNPFSMALWLDTSSTPNVLKQYNETSAMWVSIPTTYIKITSKDANFGAAFAVGDAVTISGIKGEKLSDLNSTTIVWGIGDDYIIVTGIIDQYCNQYTPIKVARQMPNLDFIIESGNRLWGCRYGVALNGEVVNEIYASKLGDFKNWNSFAGVSTDSYAATVGTDGQFTGAITHLGYPLFFKENCVHKVYGNYPANYQIQTTACRGVQKGCEKSLAIVNETLYYKARSAVCAFDGSLPTEISSAFGEEQYYNAVAGTLGNKYYVSMSDSNEEWHLFVYDTLKGMWHREDDTEATCFCTSAGDLFYIDRWDKQIKSVRGTGVRDTAPVKWEAVTGVIGTDSPDKKYISRLDVRLKLDIGARVTFYAEYDSSGEWEHLFTMKGENLKSFAVPVRPQRCDHMRLRIVGSGDAKVYSICKTIEQGSDV